MTKTTTPDPAFLPLGDEFPEPHMGPGPVQMIEPEASVAGPIRPALMAARACIQQDRQALADSHTSVDGLDEDGAAGVAEYDEVLQQIEEALAAQAEPATVELAWLEGWLQFADECVGVECCGHGVRGECCGNPDPVRRQPADVIEAMAQRHRVLTAMLSEKGKEGGA